MTSTVRVTNVEVKNLKNVKSGRFHTNSTFDNLKAADVVGFDWDKGTGTLSLRTFVRKIERVSF